MKWFHVFIRELDGEQPRVWGLGSFQAEDKEGAMEQWVRLNMHALSAKKPTVLTAVEDGEFCEGALSVLLTRPDPQVQLEPLDA